jgi:hypothetical protein
MTENHTVLDNVLGWLHEGYPEGVPQKDCFPLLVLLKRSLTEEEVVKAAQSILKASDSDSVTEDEIREAVHAVIEKEPNPEESTRSPRGWPPSVGHWRRRLAEPPPSDGPQLWRAGGRQRLVSRRSGWVSGTCTKISRTPSGSTTCISCRPHGSCFASRAISTPRPLSSSSVAYTSRT